VVAHGRCAMMELTGEIPGLLRRCSPLIDPSDGERSVVVSVVEGIGVRCSVERDCRVESYNYTFRSLCLDLSDPTGRFHARLWLLEQGHDVGNEDRAEVLAWSVLSVWRGGPAMPMVAGEWEYEGEGDSNGSWARYHRTHPSHQAYPAGCVWPENGGWRAWKPDIEKLRSALTFGIPDSSEIGEAGKAACDARLLTLGWALTNPDGTLTLPPLPGVK